MRINTGGTVRCPERFFGRVIGKKGIKINTLSKLNKVTIKLVRV
jgi:hypothetical protein